MAGTFGGTIKLTGESAYRNALRHVTSDLQNVSKALKSQTAEFTASDKAMKSDENVRKSLNDTIKKQQDAINTAKGALAQYQVELTKQQANHSKLTSEYKKAVQELERIRKTSGETSDEYKKQAEVVDKLGTELADSNREMNETKEGMSKLKSEINSSQKTMDNAKKSLDELGDEAEDSGEQAKKGGEGFTVFKGIVADLASRAIVSALNGLKKLGSAVFNVGKQAFNSYADYEQLKGGIETLFGAGGQTLEEYAKSVGKTVKEAKKEYDTLTKAESSMLSNAQNAYKTAGLSANQYMEQATSFSASLISSLGGDTTKAVEYADRAMTDMSDNANKMGTDIGMIQNAYQGFAKQNYTMLDNLKLGYGGTKTEMERLISDASKMTDIQDELNLSVKDGDLSFANITNAISVMQKKMGIMGTTTKEAEGTIQGSTQAMKSSWENLLTGLADEDQDLSPLIDNFVESVLAVGENAGPRIKQILEGMGELIKRLWDEVLPKLADEVPELKPFVNALQTIKNLAPVILASLGAIVTAIGAMKFVNFINQMKTMVSTVKSWELATKASTIAQKAQAVATKAVTAVQKVLNAVFNKAKIQALALKMQTVALTVAQKAQAVASKAVAVAQKVLNAVMRANPIGLVVTAVLALVTAFVTLWNKSEKFREFWIKLWEKIKTAVKPVIDNLKKWFSETWDKIKKVWEKAKAFFQGVWDGIKAVFSVVKSVLTGDFKGAWDGIKNIWNKVKGYFSDIWKSIKEVFSSVGSWFKDKFSDAWKKIKDVFSPITSWFGDKWKAIKNVFKGVATWFGEKFRDAWNKIKNVFSPITGFFSGIWGKIKGTFSKLGTSLGDAIGGAVKAGINRVIGWIEKTINKAIGLINGVINIINKLPGVEVGKISTLSLPRLERGGVLKRGQVGLLEGNGAEAVVPLERNTQWIKRVANEMSASMYKQNMDANRQQQSIMNYNTIVNAFKDALSQMKVELDDEEVGTFIDKTVTRLIYN